MKHIFYISILLLLPCWVVAEINQNNRNKATNNTYPNGEIIYIYTTEACHCMLNRCKSMKKDISSIITSISNNHQIKYTQIDYSKESEKADKKLTKYNQFSPPCVFVIDKNKRLLYKASNSIDRKKLREIILSLIKKRGKQ